MHYHKNICAEFHKLRKNLHLQKGDNEDDKSTCNLRLSKNPFINFYRSYELTHPHATILSVASHVAKLWSKMNKQEKKRFTFASMMKLREKRDKHHATTSSLNAFSIPCTRSECDVNGRGFGFGINYDKFGNDECFSAPPALGSVIEMSLKADPDLENELPTEHAETCHRNEDEDVKPKVNNFTADTLCSLGTETCFLQNDPLTIDAAMQVALPGKSNLKLADLKDNWNESPKFSLIQLSLNKPKGKYQSSSSSSDSSVQFIGEERLPDLESINSTSTDDAEIPELPVRFKMETPSRTIYERRAKSKAREAQKRYARKSLKDPVYRNSRKKRTSKSRSRQRQVERECIARKRAVSRDFNLRRRRDENDSNTKHTKESDDFAKQQLAEIELKSYKDILSKLTRDIRTLKSRRQMYDNLCAKCRNSNIKEAKKSNKNARNRKRDRSE